MVRVFGEDPEFRLDPSHGITREPLELPDCGLGQETLRFVKRDELLGPEDPPLAVV